ncbi:MAG TPA: rhamnulokinase family protein, partial [Bryobacteraceae bacterium]|nr:rhamnulokinase family protein [Bryobacteraceae bacterium]
ALPYPLMGTYLAFDLGAESGRAILGCLSHGQLAIDELHRFPNTPLREADGLFWDYTRLWHEIQHALHLAVTGRRTALDGIGVDTWGVDFGLLGPDGTLLEKPRHYRDSRNAAAMGEVLRQVPREELFQATGVQLMQLNTLFQLYAMHMAGSPALAAARRLLNMPDLINYALTGEARSEITIASTTQFFNPCTMTWATDLLRRLGLPTAILAPLTEPGTRLAGMIDPPHVPVYCVGGHDTASAVAAAPADGWQNWCYISSGTWSLMGLELDRPIINEASRTANYTNEVGVGGKIRFLKNIAGMWLIEECRRAWRLEGVEYTHSELMRMAAAAPFRSAIDPDAFLEPGDMPRKIAQHCRACGHEPPASHGEFVRTILESLALRYCEVLDNLERISGRKIEVIHIVGGGSKNRLLNQIVAGRTGRLVIAGPSEATAIGNILVQALGAGELSGLDEIRAVVRRSFAPEVFQPHS